MTQTCPSCAQPAEGRFCSHCGVAVSAECRECGNALPPGARFCNQCGATVAAAPAPAATRAPERSALLPWAVAGAAVLALAAVLLVSRPWGEEERPAAAAPDPMVRSGTVGADPAGAAAAAPAGDPRGVDLSSMTPREAADRLFNRVMQNLSSGDTVQARRFVPMAIQAYGLVPELDSDGRYHLSVLHLVNGDAQSAKTESNAILARDPNHLFGLFVAAQAEQATGNQERARELYRRFLTAYDTEIARDLPEYRDHRQALPSMRGEAERVAGG